MTRRTREKPYDPPPEVQGWGGPCEAGVPIASLIEIGELLVIDGSTDLKPNQSVQFVLRYGDETYSTPARCGGYWYVNGVAGGSEILGFIDSCGKYTAPAPPPPEQPLLIQVNDWAPDTMCFDCCPSVIMNVRVLL
jgi:hypothetical protein